MTNSGSRQDTTLHTFQTSPMSARQVRPIQWDEVLQGSTVSEADRLRVVCPAPSVTMQSPSLA
jgi:hypothetical protein